MRRIPVTSLLFLFVALPCVSVEADFGSHTDTILAALRGGTLSSPSALRSANDFDQNGMSADAFDRKIAGIIRGYAGRRAGNHEIEIPVNTRRLRYLGFRHSRDLGFFTGADLNRHLRIMNRSFHVYQYGKFRILVQGQGTRDYLNVYHAVRALNIHRFRYPQIWAKYFASMHGVPNSINRTQVRKRWINTARATVIAFVDCGAIASNIYDIGYVRGRRFGMPLYHNTHLIYINPVGIFGKNSRFIYRKSDRRLNYAMYLREGIIDSLLHERLHGYISAYNNLSPFFYYIRNHSRNYYSFEEPVVNNTSISLLEMAGGMSARYISYYRWMFGRQIRAISARLPGYRRFLRKYAAPGSAGSDRALFRLDRVSLSEARTPADPGEEP